MHVGMTVAALVVTAALLAVVSTAAIAPTKAAARSESETIIAGLRAQLARVSPLLHDSRFATPAAALMCSCDDYCSGACFAPQCAPCEPTTFSFPGGAALCFEAQPLGSGLLCRVDSATGAVTTGACCNTDGPSCYLPRNSCCADGSCARCASPSRNSTLVTKLFPPLNASQNVLPSGVRRRIFTASSSCEYATP